MINIVNIPKHICIRELPELENTRRASYMQARTEQGQRGASGKSSIWFPLGGHVLKALLSSRPILFRNLFCRSLYYLIVTIGGLRAQFDFDLLFCP
jgi:hypothetical protein